MKKFEFDKLANAVYNREESRLHTYEEYKAIEKKLGEEHIQSISLGKRLYNILNYEGIKTINDLCKRTRVDLLKIPSLGKESLSYIEAELRTRRRTLKGAYE